MELSSSFEERVHPAEGHVLRLVKEKTNFVLLPNVVDIITDNFTNKTYIVQQKLKGTMLSEIIESDANVIDESTLLNIGSELSAFLKELSKLDGDSKRLGLLGREGCFDHGVFVRYDKRKYGRGCMDGIKTTEEFVRWIDDYSFPYGLSREERDASINDFKFDLPPSSPMAIYSRKTSSSTKAAYLVS